MMTFAAIGLPLSPLYVVVLEMQLYCHYTVLETAILGWPTLDA